MTKPFDPYHNWLAIPPADQPANCYRLLGVAQFETDAGVIESAADRQMAHVRTFANGPHAAMSQRVLNELSQARVTLLDPKRRAAYDTVLKRATPADRAEEAKPPAATKGKPVIVEPPPGMTDEPRQLGPYKIEERITSSSLGVIYKAADTRDGRHVSIKILPPQAARNPEILKRFRRECELMTKLDHPNLIAGIEAGEERGVPYLVTEYVVGMDLGTLVQTHGALDVDYARDYIAQAARALMQLHFNGVFHRNLKPQVLLVDLSGRLRVTNLLLAKVLEGSEFDPGEQLTQMGQMVGSADYMAPEQAINPHGVDARADIYSLGCTLHFLLTGKPPYGGKSLVQTLQAHRQSPIPLLQEVRDDVPNDLELIYERMMQKEIDGRYQDIGSLVEALEGKATGRRTKKGPSMNTIIAIAVTVLLMVVALSWLALSNR